MFFLEIIVLLMLSAWFAGMEIALFSLTPAAVKSLVLSKAKNAKLLEKILKNKRRLLVILLLGATLINVITASSAGLWVEDHLGSKALGLATGIVTILILVFGEMCPKTFFQARAEKMALLFVPVIYILEIVFYPVIFLLEKLLIVMTGKKQKGLVSTQEFKAMSRIAVEHGVLHFKEHEMIMNILRFGNVQAKDIMTPRYRMSIVNDEVEIDQIAYFMAQEGYSRYPVYHNQEDNIIGYVHLSDVMRVLNSKDREDKLTKYVSPIIKIDENSKIEQIFRQMIKKRIHVALVYRHKTQLLGLVTLEDMLEEIVGEIEDENDQEAEAKAEARAAAELAE